jgi:tetratricopeptide (TPR) repeat protein
LLARQEHLDAAMLAVPEANDPKKLRPWAVGVLSGSDLYLFDPTLGLPIPAPGGIKLGSSGQLDVRPATLAEVVADEKLLRQLDLEPSQPYPVKAADLKHVVALVEASPAYLANRMQVVQAHLAAEQAIVLSTSPTPQAAKLKAVAHVSEVRLWLLPYETLFERCRLGPQQVQQRLGLFLPFYSGVHGSLLKGRTLYLRGKLTGPQGAAAQLQKARPSESELTAAPIHEIEKRLFGRAKQDATYWLGLIAFQRANYTSAVDYFARRTLEASPQGPWTHGAHYNLARTCEALRAYEEAVARYEADAPSPAHWGSVLRARWLMAQQPAAEATPAKAEPAPPKDAIPEPEAAAPKPADAEGDEAPAGKEP